MSADPAEVQNLVDAAAQSAAAAAASNDGKPDAAAAAAAAAAAKPALAFSYDEKASEQVFGKPGEDGRPANVEPKYWDAEKKQIKGDVVFNQLLFNQRKVSEGFGKAAEIIGAPPEGTDYTIEAPAEFNVEIPADDPAVKALFSICRKYDLSQKVVSDLAAEWAKEEAAFRKDVQPVRAKEELKKLGENGVQRVNDLADFMVANLPAEQAESLKGLLKSATSIEALEALISKAAPPKFATKDDQAAAVSSAQAAKDEWHRKYFAVNERGERLMSVDPEYKKAVDALAVRAFGSQTHDASGRIVNG